jgi:hypothetical protein
MLRPNRARAISRADGDLAGSPHARAFPVLIDEDHTPADSSAARTVATGHKATIAGASPI